MPLKRRVTRSRLNNLSKGKKKQDNNNKTNYGKCLLAALPEAKHLKPFFCKQQFLMNPTHWTLLIFPLCQMKTIVTPTRAWRFLTVAATRVTRGLRVSA